jgi:hypothetical protein
MRPLRKSAPAGHGRGVTMLALSAVLLPTRPRTAAWLATREPAISELEHAGVVSYRVLRILWPELGWFATGLAAGAGIAAARYASPGLRPRVVGVVFSRHDDTKAAAADVPAAAAAA